MATNRKSIKNKALIDSARALKNAQTTRLTPQIPRQPAWLPQKAVVIWKNTVKHLKIMGISTECDGFIIAAFSTAVARWIECEASIEENGLTFTILNSGNVRKRPEVDMGISYLKEAVALAAKLGLSPIDRERLSLLVEKPEEAKKDFYIVD